MSKDRNPSFRNEQDWPVDYKAPEAVWQPANPVFRRYANGLLDYNYACAKIFEALDKARDHIALTEFEKAVLSIIVPGIVKVGEPPSAVAMTKVRLAPEETAKLQLLVAARKSENINYRAGW
tara:strand:+ start:397 stop:762 length:366 start_codon:yes stop_codon:yes gene_type:complete